jgi:multiple antibiotic resistance protein
MFMAVAALLHLLKDCLIILSALFPIVNPIGNTPIFLSLTPGYSTGSRQILSWKIALNSFWLLTVSMLVGTHILNFFGISIPVVQVGGGLVVVATGWTLLQRDPEEAQASSERKVTKEDIANRAFYPLTLPLTVGPGSISVAITLGADQAHHGSFLRLAPAIIGPALLAGTVYLSYRFAENIARAAGQTAMNVVVRLSSFILVCIGVGILWNGIRALLTSIR